MWVPDGSFDDDESVEDDEKDDDDFNEEDESLCLRNLSRDGFGFIVLSLGFFDDSINFHV